MFNIEPEIPPNTGNIMRLVANTGCILHLIQPLGFSLEDKYLKRAGMDYINRVNYILHPNFEHFFESHESQRMFLCSTKASTLYNDINFQQGDTLIFGPETRGLPKTLLDRFPSTQKIYIPMKQDGRSLNLATAIITYEAWSQINFL